MDADRFAADWIAAWNAHDLEAILGHYADDVVSYPGWGKVFAGEHRPRGGGVSLCFREADAVDYYAGAKPPPERPGAAPAGQT